ncbi:MAG: Rossmann-like and DUF2520 domain-containing protein [Planctomycetota bacterium]|jgi:predicted short-subunit dehydrogenase-like oxidoreductase (DUF2520 family)
MKIAFVGCGAAGRALARLWLSAGHEIGAIHARTTAEQAVAAVGAGVANGPLQEADIVVFATPDDAIAETARTIALRSDQVALHLSGFHPSTLLAPTGARFGALHPLRAFAGLDVDMSESWCFVEGDEVAEQLARDLGGKVARIDTDKKALYHAGAAIASNYTVTLFAWARRCLAAAGVAGDEALLALVRGSIENVQQRGVPDALTGPVARGDIEVVRAHLDSLPAAEKPLYRALLAATIPLGRAKGTLSETAAEKLRHLSLENGDSRP